MIRRLTRAILRTQPPRKNPSGSGWIASAEARSLLAKIGHFLGMTELGILAAPAVKVTKFLFGGGKTKRARQATRTRDEIELPPMVTPRAGVMSLAQQPELPELGQQIPF